MIDTITLYKQGRNFELNEDRFKKKLNESNKPEILYNTFYNPEGKQPIYIHNDLKHSFVKVQFSTPKLIYNTSLENVKLEDTSKIEGILNKRLEGIFEDDFNNMQVSRLDVTQNIEVSNDIPIYIHSLHEAYNKDKRYKEEIYSNETITIKNNSRRFTLYDKVKEALFNKDISNSEASLYPNLLRFEVQHSKAKHIKTSFNRIYTLEEIFTEGFFETAKLFQVNSFDRLFCNYGNYELFMQDIALMDIVAKYSKGRNSLKNFIIRSITETENLNHDFTKYEDLLKLNGMSRQGISKNLKELRTLLSLARLKTSDLIEEIRSKLVA